MIFKRTSKYYKYLIFKRKNLGLFDSFKVEDFIFLFFFLINYNYKISSQYTFDICIERR